MEVSRRLHLLFRKLNSSSSTPALARIASQGFSNNLMRRALPAAQMYQGVNAYGNPAWFVASPSVVG